MGNFGFQLAHGNSFHANVMTLCRHTRVKFRGDETQQLFQSILNLRRIRGAGKLGPRQSDRDLYKRNACDCSELRPTSTYLKRFRKVGKTFSIGLEEKLAGNDSDDRQCIHPPSQKS